MQTFQLFAVEAHLRQISLRTTLRGQPEPGHTLNIFNTNPKRGISRQAKVRERWSEMSPVMACELSFGESRKQIFNAPALMKRGIPFVQAAVVRVCPSPGTLQALAGWNAQHCCTSKTSKSHCADQGRKAKQAGRRHWSGGQKQLCSG